MYNHKKIIVLTGKIGSGKSFLLSILRDNTATLCIDCDEVVAKLMPLAKREAIIEKQGLRALEETLYPAILATILKAIDKTKHDLVCVEGIKAKQLLGGYIDLEIKFNTPEKIRKARSLMRGDSLEKFNRFNKIQK